MSLCDINISFVPCGPPNHEHLLVDSISITNSLHSLLHTRAVGRLLKRGGWAGGGGGRFKCQLLKGFFLN